MAAFVQVRKMCGLPTMSIREKKDGSVCYVDCVADYNQEYGGKPSDIVFSGSSSRNTGELLTAFAAMNPAQWERAVSLLEAMVAGFGVREAAIAFLETRGVTNAAVEADRILNDAEGVG